MIPFQNVEVSEVPKVVEEEKKEKKPKAARDSKSTRRTRQGSFWQNGKLAACGYNMITIKE